MVNVLELSWHGSQCSLSLAVTVRSRNLMSKLLIADVAGNDAFFRNYALGGKMGDLETLINVLISLIFYKNDEITASFQVLKVLLKPSA